MLSQKSVLGYCPDVSAGRLLNSILPSVGDVLIPPCAIANSRDLAMHVEKWGYTRFWMAEHHNMANITSSATSVLLGHVADAAPGKGYEYGLESAGKDGGAADAILHLYRK